MKTLLFILIIMYSVVADSQTYLHPTSGIASTFVGTCMVNTCSGIYYDNGGPGANYSNNIGITTMFGTAGIYRVFCPTSPSMCVRLTFTTFSVECANPPCTTCWDYLTITNSPTQNGPVLFQGCSNGALPPGNPFTASNSSGCLSVRFFSDASVNRPGWSANISCVSCTHAPGGQNNDCTNFTAICSNSSFSGNSTGPGFNSESCTGCTAGGENYSNWYFFQVQTGGTFGFTINPLSPTGDYDYALYGPNVTCTSLGTPIRCSYAANTGPTGLGNGATDTSEGVTGDAWTSTISVTAGQTFYLMINQWEATANGFTINFGGSASLNCAVLPVELKSFQCETFNNGNFVSFETLNEINTEFYSIERAGDDFVFEEIAKIPSRRTASQYVFMDEKPLFGNNYYRLVQYGKDRTRNELGKITSCQNYNRKKYFYRTFDLSGKLILESEYEGNDLEKHLRSNNSIPAGVYFIHLFESSSNTSQGTVFKFFKTLE